MELIQLMLRMNWQMLCAHISNGIDKANYKLVAWNSREALEECSYIEDNDIASSYKINWHNLICWEWKITTAEMNESPVSINKFDAFISLPLTD